MQAGLYVKNNKCSEIIRTKYIFIGSGQNEAVTKCCSWKTWNSFAQ